VAAKSLLEAVGLPAQLEGILGRDVELSCLSLERLDAFLQLEVVLDQPLDVVELSKADEASGHKLL
jgi:hypothetical protein